MQGFIFLNDNHTFKKPTPVITSHERGNPVFNVEELIPGVKTGRLKLAIVSWDFILLLQTPSFPSECRGTGEVNRPLTEEVEWGLCFKTLVLITPDRAEI